MLLMLQDRVGSRSPGGSDTSPTCGRSVADGVGLRIWAKFGRYGASTRAEASDPTAELGATDITTLQLAQAFTARMFPTAMPAGATLVVRFNRICLFGQKGTPTPTLSKGAQTLSSSIPRSQRAGEPWPRDDVHSDDRRPRRSSGRHYKGGSRPCRKPSAYRLAGVWQAWKRPSSGLIEGGPDGTRARRTTKTAREF